MIWRKKKGEKWNEFIERGETRKEHWEENQRETDRLMKGKKKGKYN